MQPGRRVAFDIGKSRIGVAVSDPHGILASPRDFVSRAVDDEKTFSDLVDIISEAGAIAVFVGLPANLKNQNTESTRDAITIARHLAKLAEIPVRMVDERFTTKIASSAMSQAGKSTRHQRAGIDSAAAAIILETALDYERLNSEFAGTPIEEFADDYKYKRRGAFVLIVAFLALALCLGYLNRGAIRNAWDVVSGADYSGSGTGSVTLVIRDGDDGATIAEELVSLGVVKSYRSVYKLLISKDQIFYPGTYQLKRQMSSAAALNAIADPSNRISNRVTIKEGWRITKVLKELSVKTGVSLADLSSVAQNPTVIGVPATEVSAEGWLFPATYQFEPDATAKEILSSMVQRMKKELERFAVPSSKAHQILTLAALIQAEARLEPDFYKVSRVFLNRIEAGMHLQSDATVSYGVNGKTVSTSAADRANPNRYNTYLYPGLPVGPISAPGSVAIDAALHPAVGKWLYFCTVNLKTGETVFSNTYAEHGEAVKKWRLWMQENPGYE